VALESANAFASARVPWWHILVVGVVALELPHSDGSIQTAGNKFSAGGRERNRVDAILVSRVATSFFESLEKVSAGQLPHSHTLVQTAGGQETVVW
jgi:hypothetical protein